MTSGGAAWRSASTSSTRATRERCGGAQEWARLRMCSHLSVPQSLGAHRLERFEPGVDAGELWRVGLATALGALEGSACSARRRVGRDLDLDVYNLLIPGRFLGFRRRRGAVDRSSR